MQLLRGKKNYESDRVFYLPVTQIVPNRAQPRVHFDEAALAELAGSIRRYGVLQPLTVRRSSGGGFELVAGERRLRAARLAGLDKVPCLPIQVDGQMTSLLALTENIQRKDLDFWEEALALRRLLDTFHLSQEETARRVGKSQSAIANKLRLLKLPPEVLSRLRDGGFTERHARALLRLEDPITLQQAVDKIVEGQLTVAQTEALVEELCSPPGEKLRKKPLYVLKDVRLFLNTLNRSMDLMRSAGVNAQCRREDREDSILLTISIPRGVS